MVHSPWTRMARGSHQHGRRDFAPAALPRDMAVLSPSLIAGFDGRRIRTPCLQTSDGNWWIATPTRSPDASRRPDQLMLAGTNVLALTEEDLTGTVFFGTQLRLLGFFSPREQLPWYWFRRVGTSPNQGPDWRPLDLAALPGPDEVFLPPGRMASVAVPMPRLLDLGIQSEASLAASPTPTMDSPSPPASKLSRN